MVGRKAEDGRQRTHKSECLNPKPETNSNNQNTNFKNNQKSHKLRGFLREILKNGVAGDSKKGYFIGLIGF
jgi:hypothetical protein